MCHKNVISFNRKSFWLQLFYQMFLRMENKNLANRGSTQPIWHTFGIDTLLVLTHLWVWHSFGFDTLFVLTHIWFWHTFCLFVREKDFSKIVLFLLIVGPFKGFIWFFLVWLFWTIDFFWIIGRQIIFFWNFWGYFSVNFWSL